MATTTMSVGEYSLVTQYLDLCQSLASMGKTISFSLTLGSTLYFSNDVPSNSQVISIVKKTIHKSPTESPEVPIKETAIGSVHNEAPDIPVGNKDKLHA